MRGRASTGAGIKRGILERAAAEAVRESNVPVEENLHRDRVARGERLETIVGHQFFGEVEAVLLQDVFALASATDETLIVRASAARGALRAIERIHSAVRQGKESAKLLAEARERAVNEEDSDERSRPTRRTGHRSAKPGS